MSEPLPIIILGCPRSGTTLLRRLIGAHPHIHCAGETFLLRAAARFLTGETVAEGINYGPLGGLAALGVPAEDVMDRLRRFVLRFHEEIAAGAGKPRFAIKTAVDSFYTPEIVSLFSGHAQFLCVLRHGMDVALSLREFIDVMEGSIEELMPFIDRHHRLMPACAAAWSKVTSDLVDAAEAHPDHVFALRYEDLTEQPEEVLREVFDFIGEPIDIPSLLKNAFEVSDVQGLGDYKTFETEGLLRDRIGRWRDLPERVQAEMAEIVNPLLERLGHEVVSVASGPTNAMRMHELAMMYKNANRDQR